MWSANYLHNKLGFIAAHCHCDRLFSKNCHIEIIYIWIKVIFSLIMTNA